MSIPELHAAYVRLTGQPVELNPFREQQWCVWLGFRRENPFTASDLATVIAWLKGQIRKGERRPGALKFSNLIGNPDYFEEDLSLARSQLRAKPIPPRQVTTPKPDGSTVHRQIPGDPAADATRSARAVIESAAFKEFVNLKEKL